MEMGAIMIVPWVLGLVTAIWFGLQARRSGRGVVIWSLAGGLFGLITSTFIFGLGHGACIPFSDGDGKRFYMEWTGIAIVVIAVFGWLFTLGLARGQTAASSPGAAARS
jgi:hypothetical protein